MKAILLLVLFAPSLSWAAPFVCFTGKPVAENGRVWLAGGMDGDEVRFELARWNPSCEALEKWETGLNATSLIFAGTGYGLACTGIGLPATVWLEGAAIGASALGLIIGQLPCDNRIKDAEIKKLAEAVVCEELAKQGIRCLFR